MVVMYSLVFVFCFYSVFLYFNYIIFVLIVFILFVWIVRLCNNDMFIILVFIFKNLISFYINECKKNCLFLWK